MSRELITVKGTRNGLVFYFNTKDAAFKEIEDTLVEKFQNAKGFFSQARFMISPENDLTEEQIKAIEEICLHHGMTKSSVGPGTPKYDGSLQRRVDQDTKVSDTMDNAVLICRSLRSGQKIYVTGHCVIRGDVNPGAHVAATGSIIVMGTFRGTAHAGIHGDQSAFVMAYRLRPSQIGIADKLSRSPETLEESGYPEIALIVDNHIVVEPYNLSRRKAANL